MNEQLCVWVSEILLLYIIRVPLCSLLQTGECWALDKRHIVRGFEVCAWAWTLSWMQSEGNICVHIELNTGWLLRCKSFCIVAFSCIILYSFKWNYYIKQKCAGLFVLTAKKIIKKWPDTSMTVVEDNILIFKNTVAVWVIWATNQAACTITDSIPWVQLQPLGHK